MDNLFAAICTSFMKVMRGTGYQEIIPHQYSLWIGGLLAL
jgi:hypothetical protein